MQSLIATIAFLIFHVSVSAQYTPAKITLKGSDEVFTNLQDAVNAAEDSSVIYVSEGTLQLEEGISVENFNYLQIRKHPDAKTKPVLISKTFSCMSIGSCYETVIDGLVMEAKKTRFDEEIYGACVYISRTTNVTVSNCEMYNSGYGITASGSEGLKIENNYIHHNEKAGIRLFYYEDKKEKEILLFADRPVTDDVTLSNNKMKKNGKGKRVKTKF